MNYIILIILILLSGLTLYTSYIYNNIYLRIVAGSILLVLGLALFLGVSYPTGDSITNTYNLTEFEEEDNCTTTTTGSIISTDSKVYTLWNDYITKAIALILTLAGALIFIYQPLTQKQVIK